MIKCALCHLSFGRFTNLKAHHNFYHGGQNYYCSAENCSRVYDLFPSYKRHYLREHEPKTNNQSSAVPLHLIKCALCHLSFDRFANLKAHHNFYHGGQNYSCSAENCTRFFSLFPSYKRHYLKDHEPETNNPESQPSAVPLQLTVEPSLAIASTSKSSPEVCPITLTPIAYTVGQRFDYINRNGNKIHPPVDCVAYRIPLKEGLQNLFSIKNLLHDTISYMKELMKCDASQLCQHFVHGSYWQARQNCHGDKLVIPLFLQVEELKPPGAEKFGAAYVSLPCLPSHYASSSQVLLALLYNSSDRVEFGNRAIFQPLIDEFNCLSRVGITFDLPNFKGTVFWELSLILGDDSVLQSITGFVEDSCRTCKVPKAVMSNQFYDNPDLLRNVENYKEDLAIADESKTGVKERCVWLGVDHFDLFNQVGVDVLHDINEDVFKHVLGKLLRVFIDKSKFFTLELMNNKLMTFDFGADTCKKPLALSMDHIREENIRLSGAQIGIIFKYFAVMFGDLIPRDNEHWDIYLKLRQIVDLAMAAYFEPKSVCCVRILIAEFCELYTSLFETSLEPKMHNLLHYHTAMLKFGPLRHLSSLRVESKQRSNELASETSSNGTNLTDLADRHQLMMNDVFLRGELKGPITTGRQQQVHSEIANGLLEKLGLDTNKLLELVNWTTFGSSRFCTGTVLMYDSNEDGLLFMMVSRVYLYDSSKLIFTGSCLETVCLDSHYHAYEVQEMTQGSVEIVITYDSLQCPIPCHITRMGYGVPPTYLATLRVV